MILLYILIVFALLRSLVILANLLTRQWLRPHKVSGHPTISILIPARNEEKNIGRLLQELVTEADKKLSSCLPADNSLPLQIIEILVYNDQSTDETSREVKKVMGVQHVERIENGREVKNVIRLIEGGLLPEDWLGKNYACHRLGQEASGDWLLFLDADVRVSPDLLRHAVGYAQEKRISLLSLFPRQDLLSAGEWMVVPLMNWILVSLLPLILIRTCRWTSFAAANGQFMLFRGSSYKRFQWHSLVKSDPVEDIRISRLMKKKRMRTATLLSAGQIRCRMYGSYHEALNGFSKNIGQFFGNSLIWMLIFSFLTTIGPIVLIPLSFSFTPSILPYLLVYFLLLLFIRTGFSVLSRQNLLKNLLYWFPQQLVLIVLVWKSIRFRLGRKIEWKGRPV